MGNNTPSISVPQGGGAIKSIGEKFQANPVMGTGSFTIPIPTSPGRNGFGPKLSLQYSTGYGNGPFGLGWKLSIPRITRKTEKGLPSYTDDDVFVLSDAEDLVVKLKLIGDKWNIDEKHYVFDDVSYLVRRFCPRNEGLYARIEMWKRNDGDVHWRVVTKENITNIYGRTLNSRLYDLSSPEHIFEWLLEETYDAKGNHILYEYVKENPQLRISGIWEKNREYNQIYIRRIHYGNTPEGLAAEKIVGSKREGVHHKHPNSIVDRHYSFEVIFDYGDLPELPQIPFNPQLFPDKETPELWPVRPDPFSSYRAGFEIRTLRLCTRVLMLNHFNEEDIAGAPLVSSVDFTYHNNPQTRISMLVAVNLKGFRKSKNNTYSSADMPPVTLKYSEFTPHEQNYQSVLGIRGDLPPKSLEDSNIALIDLFGNSLPDILQTTEHGYYYWKNLGNALLDSCHPQHSIPAGVGLASPYVGIGDMGGDGLPDLVISGEQMSGFCEATQIGVWKPFREFGYMPSFLLSDPNVRLIDLTGDGLSDILVSSEDSFLWFKCMGESGYSRMNLIPRKRDLNEFPDVYFDDSQGRVRLADISGDGLDDIILIHNGRIDYWPNMGRGRFGKRVTMGNPPHLDFDIDPKRLFLADIDGSGATDIIYVDNNRVHFWFNQSGNSWSEKETIFGTPFITDLSSVRFVDFYGNGTATLVWSYDYGVQAESNYKVLDFCGGKKPYLLTEMCNNMGATTRVQYASSTKFYLEDKKNGLPWITNLPFPVQVVEKTEVVDHISKTKLVTLFKYHHGYFDGKEREFRGFGRVDQYDTEFFETFIGSSLHKSPNLFKNDKREYYVPPILTKTWFHMGVYFDENHPSANGEFYDEKDMMDAFREEFYNEDEFAFLIEDHDIDESNTVHEAYRALRGAVLRKEVYALDGTGEESHPYTVTQNRYRVRQLQPKSGNPYSVYSRSLKESFFYHYERNPHDPRIRHTINLNVDEFGNVTDSVAIAYPRRPCDHAFDEQKKISATYSWSRFINKESEDSYYYVKAPCEVKTFEVHGIDWSWPKPLDSAAIPIKDSYFATLLDPNEFEPYSTKEFDGLKKRVVEWTRSYYRKDENPLHIDTIGNLHHRLPLGEIDPLGLPYEIYRVAFTTALLAEILGERADIINPALEGGYHPHPNHPHVEENASSYWWIPSGRHAFDDSIFFQITRHQDVFGELSEVQYDDYGLFIVQAEDALSLKEGLNNEMIAQIDYRVLQPKKVTDVNGTVTEVRFNSLGLLVGTSISGVDEHGTPIGDSLEGFVDDLENDEISTHFESPLTKPHEIVKKATSRMVYDLHRYYRTGTPNVVISLTRETHASESQDTAFQQSFVYYDGFGREVQSKKLAEPGDINGVYVTNRWVATGTRVYNNKGSIVQEFEPYFSDNQFFAIEKHGVSPIRFYDPLQRQVCTIHPNHTYDKVVFDAWYEETWDVNDTIHPSFRYNPDTPSILPDHRFNPNNDSHIGQYFSKLPQSYYLPTWYNLRMDPTKALEKWPDVDNDGNPISGNQRIRQLEKEAAEKAAKHSATPTAAHLDSLGRIFMTIVDNGESSLFKAKVELDVEGNNLTIRDTMDREAFQNAFDIAGRKLHVNSIDAGFHQCFLDALGNPLYQWDGNGNQIISDYDELRRPTNIWVENDGQKRLVEISIYGDKDPLSKKFNRVGKLHKQYDGAGLIIFEKYDLNGSLTMKSRQFIKRSYIDAAFGDGGEPSFILNWESQDDSFLDTKKYTTSRAYDALNRITKVTYPDNTNVVSIYNVAGLLERLIVDDKPYIKRIDYDERGRRTLILYGNDVQTLYEYNPETYRLQRLLTRTNQGAGKFLQDLNYHYDPIGNITSIIDNARLPGHNPHTLDSILEHHRLYTYDPLYRLSSAEGRECTAALGPLDQFGKIPICTNPNSTRQYKRHYSYDEAGNVLKISHRAPSQGAPVSSWTKVFNYGTPQKKNNRLLKITESDETASFTYDNNGNLKSISNIQHFYWDYADRMIAATNSTASNACNTSMQALYFYDAEGLRNMKVVKCGSVIKVWMYIDGVYEEYRKESNSVLKEHKTYKHILNETQRVAIIKQIISQTNDDPEPPIVYHHGDNVGSSQVLTRDDGNFYNQEEFYPFGDTSFGSYSRKRYRYNGKERDEETGLYYFGARYYAPHLARWIGCDPAGQGEGLNLYVYVRNNPISNIDPTGYGSEPAGPAEEEKNYGQIPAGLSKEEALDAINQSIGPSLGIKVTDIEKRETEDGYDWVITPTGWESLGTEIEAGGLPPVPKAELFDFNTEEGREEYKREMEAWRNLMVIYQNEGTKKVFWDIFKNAYLPTVAVGVGFGIGGVAMMGLLGEAFIASHPVIAGGLIGGAGGLTGEAFGVNYDLARGKNVTPEESYMRLGKGLGVGAVGGAVTSRLVIGRSVPNVRVPANISLPSSGTVELVPRNYKAVAKGATDPKWMVAEMNAGRELVTVGGANVVGFQVAVRTPMGLRVYDYVIRLPNGRFVGVEIKSGNATSSRIQIVKDEFVMKEGGKMVGKNIMQKYRGMYVTDVICW